MSERVQQAGPGKGILLTLDHRGHYGRCEWDTTEQKFSGRLLTGDTSRTFSGVTREEVRADFQRVVDHLIEEN